VAGFTGTKCEIQFKCNINCAALYRETCRYKSSSLRHLSNTHRAVVRADNMCGACLPRYTAAHPSYGNTTCSLFAPEPAKVLSLTCLCAESSLKPLVWCSLLRRLRPQERPGTLLIADCSSQASVFSSNAFDFDANTYWTGFFVVGANGATLPYVQASYDKYAAVRLSLLESFGFGQAPARCSLLRHELAWRPVQRSCGMKARFEVRSDGHLQGWTLDGSNDGVFWTTLDAQVLAACSVLLLCLTARVLCLITERHCV
jgi:hypothetical protein